jgi:hypothetical protein
MPTLNQVRTKVDAWLADKWPTVVARQQNYFANRGQYWQGLRTHSAVPAFTNSQDGDAAADQLNAQPTDAFSNWSNVFPEWDGLPIPCALQIDVYDGLEGKGWVATVWVRYNGVLYTRSQNVGPESWRSQAWTVVDEVLVAQANK